MKIVDLTRTIQPDMPVFPGDPQPVFRVLASFSCDKCRIREISMGSHTGTHMDAPSHMIKDGTSLDNLPISRFCGSAILVPCEDCVESGLITLDAIRRCKGADEAEFILLRTGWEKLWEEDSFFKGYPVLDEDAAYWIVENRKKGVGLDVSSIDPVDDESGRLHHIILGGDILIIENLCGLYHLPAGLFDFCALPLKLKDADGSPVRAAAFIR